MVWRVTPFSILLAAAAGIALFHAGVAWRDREQTVAVPAATLLTAMGVWALVDGVRLGFTTASTQFLLFQFGIVVGGTIPVVWLVFTLTYAGYEHRLSRSVLGGLALEPLAFFGLVVTNDTHHLVWQTVGFVVDPVRSVSVTLGPGYLAHITLAYGFVAVGMALLVSVFLESSGIYRRQTGLLLFGALVPLLANLAFTVGRTPVTQLDLTPLTFTVSGIVFGVALFRFDLLDLTPVARREVIDTLGSGLVVLTTDNRVLHRNATAQAVLGDVDVGDDVLEALAVDDLTDLDGQVLVGENARRHVYESHVSEMYDFRGRHVGRLLALQDVTDRRAYEQRLEVANRLLRHNLRNETTKLVGWADHIAETTDDATLAEYARRIETVAWNLGALSDQARYIVSTLEGGDDPDVLVDVTEAVEHAVADVTASWPDATVTVSTPPEVVVEAQDGALLRLAFQNLVENALEHNPCDDRSVAVDVRVEASTDGVVIEVTDNGPGVPHIERTTLGETETPLHHSQGLGLWLTHWIVDAAEGSLSFEDRDPRGTVVTIRLPAAVDDPRPRSDGAQSPV
jgi:signal transduction histidine kinase